MDDETGVPEIPVFAPDDPEVLRRRAAMEEAMDDFFALIRPGLVTTDWVLVSYLQFMDPEVPVSVTNLLTRKGQSVPMTMGLLHQGLEF